MFAATLRLEVPTAAIFDVDQPGQELKINTCGVVKERTSLCPIGSVPVGSVTGEQNLI